MLAHASPAYVYKVAPRADWARAAAERLYRGSADDARDGFIHLSTAEQLAGTLARYFAGREDLVLVAVRSEAVGPALRYEASRGGALFPHLYGPLALDAVAGVADIVLGAEGHELPTELPGLGGVRAP
ncbi:MAG: DUF952 domain-containing protein [Alphaproteobacteria bacterium]|nr:DUF952 domain-containing protein [Alphaproteobacteria bacterium]